MTTPILAGHSGRLAGAFLFFCLVQFALVLYLRPLDSTPAASREWHSRLVTIVSSSTLQGNPRDFGLMAKKVSHMAQLAEEHIDAVDNGPALFNMAITTLFPWWRSDSIRYYPWMAESERPGNDTTGIVIGVGNNNVETAAVLIVTLRKVLGSTLPIELAYVGHDDLSPEWRNFLCQLVDNVDIHPLDLTEYFDDRLVGMQTFDTKPFAILASRFTRTILMDADAIFFQRPDDAFEVHPALRETGSLYFHDRSKLWLDGRRKPPDERLHWLAQQIKSAGRQPSTFLTDESLLWAGTFVTEAQDSCVVMFDKTRPRNYVSMLFTAWMNAESGGRPEVYSYFWGDKETYWIAGELTGIPFHFDPWTSARFAQAPTELATAQIDHARQLPCTEHMVHPTWDGSEPWLANDGLAQDKRNSNSAWANWTHWYLGETIPDALRRAKSELNLPSDTSFFTPLAEDIQKQFAERVLLNEPQWDLSCEQTKPENWVPLSAKFRSTLQSMVGEAEVVRKKYIAAKEEATKQAELLSVKDKVKDT